MKTSFTSYILLVISLMAGTSSRAQSPQSTRYNIIPYPEMLQPAEGTFKINDQTGIYLENGAAFNQEVVLLQQMLEQLGKKVPLSQNRGQQNVIILASDTTLTNDEAYTIKITAAYVLLSAKSSAGMFYALKTFYQLLPLTPAEKNSPVSVPAVLIKDQPAFKWRGMMLDVARAYFSIQYLEKMVDMMAMYKLNKLHLHLTDDQGWRIEIKKYPALALTGGWREFNEMDSAALREFAKTGNPDFIIDKRNLREKDGRPLFGGAYTQEQMAAFIRYAAARHIEIIPEVDMPGHMMAATRIFPNLTCDGKTGVMDGFSPPVCPCKEEVIAFAKDIFSEIAALFPSQYIHIGGDEVDQKYWAKCSLCQAFMKEHQLTAVPQIQSYFNDRMKEFFKTKGKTLVGWDEIVEGGIDSTAVVMYWRPWAPGALTKAAKNNNRIVLSPDGPFYFDAIPDRYSLSSVYNYNPFDPVYHFSEQEKKNIIGVQGNLWGQLLPSEPRADYMLMPRMTALAEVGWTNKPAYTSYLSRMEKQYQLWDQMKINYRLPDPEDIVEQQVFVGQTSYFKAAPSPNFLIRYTLDGSQPQTTSPVMQHPVKINRKTVMKLAPFTKAGRRGDVYSMQFEPTSFQKPVIANATTPGLQCELYKGPLYQTKQIRGTADSVFTLATIGVPEDLQKPSFGMHIKGFINIPETGIYTFYFNTDDGGILLLDNTLLINNDGPHGEREIGAQKALTKGLHPIEVKYVQGGGGWALSLRYSVNEGAARPVPASWYYSKQ